MAIPYDFTIKTLSDLTYLIFPIDYLESKDMIENAILVNTYQLCTYFPAKYQDTNKKALFEDLLHKKKYKPSDRNLLITRFYPKQLPIKYTIEQHTNPSKSYTFLANIFDYKATEDIDVVEWHMNFANDDLFAFYQTNLLAQDELQVLECPSLASLREYFNQQQNETKTSKKKYFNSNVVVDNLPYPILISNVERIISLDTTNLYGNNFSSSSKSLILKSYKYLNPSQIINIIAMEAPKYGKGEYNERQIEYILQECFTAYSAAKNLANITWSLNRNNTNTRIKTYIHSGWFGCGAYGGNRTIMIILQIIAAKLADIDKLIFHTVTSDYQENIDEAEDFLKNLFQDNQSSLSIEDVIEKIFDEKFQWGESNGT